MTNKIECDECHKLTEKQFVSLIFKEAGLNMGIEIVPHSYLGLDFCSLKCLEDWLDHNKDPGRDTR